MLPDEQPALPIRTGAFVAVAGASGAGKDTLIAYARERLHDEPRVHFVRRVITRPADQSLEDHDSLSPAIFDKARAEGAFAVSWEAHGLKYGLPASVDRALQAGRVAVANVSRRAVPALRLRYANVAVVEITAAPEVLAARLAGRGRETAKDVRERLARKVEVAGGGASVSVLDNSGPKETAGEALLAIIRAAVAVAGQAQPRADQR